MFQVQHQQQLLQNPQGAQGSLPRAPNLAQSENFQQYLKRLVDHCAAKLTQLNMIEVEMNLGFSVGFTYIENSQGVQFKIKHSDFYLNQQVERIFETYIKLLKSLKNAYSFRLKTRIDYEKSIMKNEDGFFLQVYKLINECQIFLNFHLDKYFYRQRHSLIMQLGGFQICPIIQIGELVELQNRCIAAFKDIVTQQALEFFPFAEEVFSRKVHSELEQVQQKLDMESSNVTGIQLMAMSIQTPFVQVYEELLQLKKRTVFEGQVITNKMIFHYLRQMQLNQRGEMVKPIVKSKVNNSYNIFQDVVMNEQISNPNIGEQDKEEAAIEQRPIESSFDVMYQQHSSQRVIHPLLIHDYLQMTTGITEKQFKMRIKEINGKLTHQEKLICDYLNLSL